jgi:hypothetical protein
MRSQNVFSYHYYADFNYVKVSLKLEMEETTSHYIIDDAL